MQNAQWSKWLTTALMVVAVTACGGTDGGEDQNKSKDSIVNKKDETKQKGDDNKDKKDKDSNQSQSVTSEGIHVAVAPRLSGLNLSHHLYPLIDRKRLYIHHTTVENVTVDSQTFQEYNLSVKAYNVADFSQDKNVSELPTAILYTNSTQVNTLHTYRFSVIHYNLTKRNDSLYFSIAPESIESETQGGLIKYDLSTKTRDYLKQNDAINNYEDSIENGKYFDLTRGWFVPFDDEHIGVVEGPINKVVISKSGTPLEIGLPYFSGPSQIPNSAIYGNPVANTKRYFMLDKIQYKEVLMNITFIADNSAQDSVKRGNRNIYGIEDGRTCQEGNLTCQYHNPNYKVTVVLEDFQAKYSGEVKYDYSGAEATYKIAKEEMMIDGDRLYVPFQIKVKDASAFDAYIIEYDMDSTITKLYFVGRQAKYMAPYFQDFTKDGNVIYYVGDDSAGHRMLVAYDLETEKPIFQHDISQPAGINRGKVPQEYILTKDTIIVPQKAVQENRYNYNMVFDVLSREDGHTIKRLQHTALRGLNADNFIRSEGVVSDQESVYYLLNRRDTQADTYQTVIVKIDSPNNTIPKEQFRYDPYLSGSTGR